MKKTVCFLFGLLLIAMNVLAFAKSNCAPQSLANHKQEVLACYLAEPENIKQPWVLESKQYDADHQVSIETYTLTSQTWPKSDLSKHSLLWKHSLIIYRPDVVKTEQALLFVEGGTRYANSLSNKAHFYLLDFNHIAAETHSVVIDLHDIPNQYLTFDDEKARTEDSIVAYSWSSYMDNPDHNSYWPVHLPMTKAVIKAMDAVQQILAQNNKLKISHFVVAGASKRGWATWLAALSDQRINAIVPIVIDILNTKENIQHIYTSYNNNWPPAFHDYVDQRIPERINTPEFDSLMRIEDPLTYLDCDNCDIYKKRLTLPKYIISASGDDFFVPDSLNLYLDRLPGETQIRVVPNQSHYIDMKIVEGALLTYYLTILNHTTRPSLKWEINKAGELKNVITDKKPMSVRLWEAENPNARDFRLAAKITYSAKELKGDCDHNHCLYPVTVAAPAKGWKASFVEVYFQQAQGDSLVLTTSTYINGHSMG